MNLETGAALRRAEGSPIDANALEYSLKPYVSAQFSQPVFPGGRFIETRSLAARDDLARSGVVAANISQADLQRRLHEIAVEVYGSVSSLRNAVETLGFAVALEDERLAQAEQDLADGLISDRQLLRLQVGANRTREALLNTRDNLRSLERRLEELAGGGIGIGDLELQSDPPVPSFDTPDQPVSADVRRAERRVQEAELQQLIGRVDRAARLSVFARLEPRYPEQRNEPDQPGAAVSDLLEGAGTDWTVGFGLRIPLYDGGAARQTALAEDLAVQQAQIEVQQARDAAEREDADYAERLQLLRQRLDLLEADLELARQTEEDLAERVTAGTAGRLQLDEARLDRMQAADAAQQARWDLAAVLAQRQVLP